eukprot:8140038-Karenia_brevis.AAC.1
MQSMRSGTQERCDISMCLQKWNKHPRDIHIEFKEDTHSYIFRGANKFPISVSGVWAQFFEPFKPAEVVETNFQHWEVNRNSNYYELIQSKRALNKSDDEIKGFILSTWTEKGIRASTKGTYIHRQIELFINGIPCDTSVVEMQQFQRFLTEFIVPRQWIPFRTE